MVLLRALCHRLLPAKGSASPLQSGSNLKPPQQLPPDWDIPKSPSVFLAPLGKSHDPALCMALPPAAYRLCQGISVPTPKR